MTNTEATTTRGRATPKPRAGRTKLLHVPITGAEVGEVKRTFAVGPWEVTIHVPQLVGDSINEVECWWLPSTPDRPLSDSEQQQYESGIAAAIAVAGWPQPGSSRSECTSKPVGGAEAHRP